MNKIGKKVMLGVLAGSIAMGAGGCNMNNNNANTETTADYESVWNNYVDYKETQEREIVEDMMQHLYRKYGDDLVEMEYHGLVQAGFAQTYDTLTVLPIGGVPEEDNVLVERYKEEDGSYTYKDNYFGLHIREDYEQMVAEIANKYFDNSKNYATFYRMISNELTYSNSLQDAINMNALDEVTVWMVVENTFDSQEEFEQACQYFYDEWATKHLFAGFNIYLLDADVYSMIDRTNYYEIIHNMPDQDVNVVVKVFSSEDFK